MSSSKPIVGYWDIRGLAQPIRLLLSYLEIEFEDNRYSRDQKGVGLEWLREKFTLGLAFPNLPYYIDEDVKLSQSVAILRYLGMKHKLDGQTATECDRLNLLEQHVEDLNWEFYNITKRTNYLQLKEDFIKTLHVQLKLLTAFLGNGPFILGSRISYVDFLLYEYLVKIIVFVPDLLEEYSALKQFMRCIETLPTVAKYIEQFKKPVLLNGPKYAWDGAY